jgi:hypothetical protein
LVCLPGRVKQLSLFVFYQRNRGHPQKYRTGQCAAQKECRRVNNLALTLWHAVEFSRYGCALNKTSPCLEEGSLRAHITQAHECANFSEWKCAERPVAAFAPLLSASQRGRKVKPWAGGGSNRPLYPQIGRWG